MSWAAILVLAAASYGLKAFGTVLVGDREIRAPARALLDLAPVPLLAALILTQTVSSAGALMIDARLPALGVAALLTWRARAVSRDRPGRRRDRRAAAVGLAARGSEAVGAALVGGRRQRLDDARLGREERHEQQLRDAVAGLALVALLAEVDQHDPDLAAVGRVDQAGAVDDGEPVARREPGAGDDEPRDDPRAAPPRRPSARPRRSPGASANGLDAAQVEARVTGAGARRRLRVGVEELDLEVVGGGGHRIDGTGRSR